MANPERIEHIEDLRRESRKHSQYLLLAAIGFAVCAGVAFSYGPAAGWPWSIGALVFAFGALWALIQARYFDLRIILSALLERQDRGYGDTDTLF